MKQEILFRGKTKSKDSKWIYGDLNHVFDGIFIFDRVDESELNSPDNYEVIPETVGLFSTIYDKKGTRIFDGDLFKLGAEKYLFEVRFEHGCFLAYRNGKQFGLVGELQICFIDVVGNSFDNPELLKAAN